MSPLAWILCVGAVYRLTLLVVADEITRPPRDWLLRRLGPDHRISYLITCPWCASVEVAAVVVATGFWWGEQTWWQYVAGLLAVAGAAAFAARYAAPD